MVSRRRPSAQPNSVLSGMNNYAEWKKALRPNQPGTLWNEQLCWVGKVPQPNPTRYSPEWTTMLNGRKPSGQTNPVLSEMNNYAEWEKSLSPTQLGTLRNEQLCWMEESPQAKPTRYSLKWTTMLSGKSSFSPTQLGTLRNEQLCWMEESPQAKPTRYSLKWTTMLSGKSPSAQPNSVLSGMNNYAEWKKALRPNQPGTLRSEQLCWAVEGPQLKPTRHFPVLFGMKNYAEWENALSSTQIRTFRNEQLCWVEAPQRNPTRYTWALFSLKTQPSLLRVATRLHVRVVPTHLGRWANSIVIFFFIYCINTPLKRFCMSSK